MRKNHGSGKRRPYQCQVELESRRSTGWLYCCLPLLVLAMCLALGYVWLQSERDRLTRHRRELRQEYGFNGKIITNLRVKREELCSGKHILGAVRRFGLGLRPPLPGQVRRVPVLDGQTEDGWFSEPMIAEK